MRESTLSLNFSSPCSACCFLLFPSTENGTVTIPTVRIPISRAVLAIIGAAPVPVPPPIPAVTNTILVFFPNDSFISSILSSAAASPTSGLAPAPRPCVEFTPNCTLFSIGLFCSACASVLYITKSTPLIPFAYILFKALFPPPPTPTTFMIDEFPFCN